MIKNEHLAELKEILLCFNNDENLTIDVFDSMIENPRLFFELLLSFNKKKVKELISVRKESKEKNKKKEINFSEEEISSIINIKTKEELEKNYSLSELKAMYEKIYSRTSPTDATKVKIVAALKKMALQQQRGTDFSKI